MRNPVGRSVVRTLALLLYSLAITSADQATAQEVIAPRFVSPFQMARAINESSRAWRDKRIVVEVDLDPTWKRFGIDASYFQECESNCEAKIYRVDLNEQHGSEVLLKLTRSYDFCRYLIFKYIRHKSGKGHWKLLGHIDHAFNRYQMSRHRVARAFGKNWLVVRGQEGSGSGYSLYAETWYEVSEQGTRPVLHYLVEGNVYPWALGLNWDFRSRAVAAHRYTNARINLSFGTRYTAIAQGDGQEGDHYVSRRLASFVWNPRLREFVFDERSSTISESEMDAVAALQAKPESSGMKIGGSVFFSEAKAFAGGGLEAFLRLNFNRLKRIAVGSNTRRKVWLTQFLKQCDATREKLALEKALANQLPQAPKQR
ncbi:MAG: hypothetical protein ACRD9S_00380 [Pyrinomonadaceae bacterium]